MRVRKPTLYNMASTGVIPNPLLETVQQLFMASAKKIEKISLEKQANALIQMARYALVEPTLDDIVAAGLTLTDEQLLALYAFAIGGAAALAPFRQGVRQRPDGGWPGCTGRGPVKSWPLTACMRHGAWIRPLRYTRCG